MHFAQMHEDAEQLQGQGKLAEAEPLYRRALEGRTRQLGADLLDTLQTVANLALLLMGQGKLTEAESLCRRALEGNERQLGASHQSTLISVNNLALMLNDRGKLA